MITVPVTLTASDQNGNPVAGARIIATLDATEIYQGFVVPEQVEAFADADGVAVLQLWPNALGVAGSRYKVRAWNPDTGKRFLDVLAAVPNNACNLHEILVQEPYPPIDAAQQALIAAQAALAPVTEQAAIATAAAEAAEADRLQADLDAQATAADRLQTGLDRQATAADRIATGQDRTATGQDRTATGADRLQTDLDRVATGQDRVQTGQDAAATAADRIATGQDRQATAADRVATGQDAQATAADRTQTGLDRAQTLLDRQATNADRTQTGLDRTQTGADRTQTGLDRQATAADRVATGQDRTQTGQDRTAASQSAGDALLSEQAAAASAALIGPPIIPAFANSAAAAPGVAVESAAVTVSGSTSTVWPAVVRGDGTPEVQVNAGPWASSAIFRAGDTIKLRNVSPPVGLNYIANLYAHSFVGVWSLSVFSPSFLFAANEPGVWYDPSDMSTMFQDAAGTTPVTAVEQPVGLILDKRRQQSWVDVTGAVWTKTSGDGVVTVSGSQITITGATTTTTVNRTAGSIPLAPGVARMSIRADYSGATGVQRWLRGTPSGLANGVVLHSSASLSNSNLERLDVSTGTVTFTVLSFDYWVGNHATQPTATARPVLKIDGNGKHYLPFDGVDDFLVTNTITPGTDKVQVFAGVRKLSDAARGVILESSASIDSNNGALLLTAPDGANSTYAWDSKGTAVSEAIGSGFAAPTTSVLTGLGDIAGDTSTLRVNGSQAAASVTDQGTGNYLANQLRIGRRGGTSLPFNGWLYSMIVRFGSNLSNDQITQTENWVNSKTGAY